MEELTNALVGFMMDAKKTRLVNIEHTHNVFMQRMKFELKVRVGRNVHAKTRMFGLIFYDGHGRGEDTDIAKLQGGVVITEISDVFPIGLRLKGG